MTLSHAFHQAGTLPVAAQFGIGILVVALGTGLWTLSNLAADALAQARTLVCAGADPWLRRAALAYLSRGVDVASPSEAHEPDERPESALPVEPADLLAAEPLVGDAPWFDPDPGLVTMPETFGPASFGWFDRGPMPHRDPDGHVPPDALPEVETDLFGGPPCPAQVSEQIVQVLTLATRFTRDAAQGGAR